jgi:hypothetical protein
MKRIGLGGTFTLMILAVFAAYAFASAAILDLVLADGSGARRVSDQIHCR